MIYTFLLVPVSTSNDFHEAFDTVCATTCQLDARHQCFDVFRHPFCFYVYSFRFGIVWLILLKYASAGY